MKRIIFLLAFLICSVSAFSQFPAGFPSRFNTLWERIGYAQSDSGTIVALRDTAWVPRFPGTIVTWRQLTDTSNWMYTGQRWVKILKTGDADASLWELNGSNNLVPKSFAGTTVEISRKKLSIIDSGFVATGTLGTATHPSPGPGVKMFWYPGKIAFRVGRSFGTEFNDASIGLASTSFGDQNVASGVGSFAAGILVSATGNGAVALGGAGTTASGTQSFASGVNLVASGINSVIFGDGGSSTAQSSFGAGRSVRAAGEGSAAFNLTTVADSAYSAAFGASSHVYSVAGFAAGILTRTNQTNVIPQFSIGRENDTLRTAELFRIGWGPMVVPTVRRNIFTIDTLAKIFVAGFPTGGSGDSVLVWSAADSVMKKVAQSSISSAVPAAESPIAIRSGSSDTLALKYGDGLTLRSADSALILDTAYVDSLVNAHPLNDKKVVVSYNAGAIIIGNSISQGGTSPYETYANMLRKVVGGAWNNYSIPGGDANIVGDMLRNNRLPFARTQLSLYNNHINAVRFNESDGVKKWVTTAVRSFLVNSFKAQSTDASAMTQVAGAWASYNGLTVTTGSKTNCLVTTDSLAELSFPVRDGQPGIFISFITNGENDTNNWSDSVEILRSGGTEVIATVNLNKQSYQNRMPYVLWLPNTNVFTTIRIRNLTSDTLVVDYAGTTALNNNLAPAFVAEVTNIATAALQPGIGHDWWDTINNVIRAVVNDEFIKYGYPVATIDVNNGLKYDEVLYMYDLAVDPPNAIHPTTYAHFNVLLPQALKKMVLRESHEELVEYVANTALVSMGTGGFPGKQRTIILPTISQNSQLNYAADSFNVRFGQRLKIINDNSAGNFSWNAVFWTFREPNGATGTLFPNRTVTELEWTREGFRVTNRYGVDSLRVSNDTLYPTISGKQLPPVVLPGGGSSGTAGADGYLQYDSSGFHGARSAYRVDNTSLKLFAGDSISTGTVVADRIRPLTTNTFGLRSISSNAISFNLLSNSLTNLLSIASDASASTTITASTGPLTIFSGSGQQLRLIASGGVSLNLLGTGLVGLNETSPAHRFQSFENATALTADRRAIYGINQATYNATAAARISAGVFGFDNSTRASGSNTVTNVGVYGLGQAGGQLTYGMVSEAMTSTTNAVVPSMRIISNSTGTAANGFGTGFFLGAENGSAANVNIAEVQAVYTDVTSPSEDADIIWRTITAGSLTEKFRLLGGTARFSGGLQLGVLANGTGTDSVLVINNTEVKKVAATSLTTLYTGDGSIPANRTVASVSNSQLTFDGFPYFNLKSSSLRFQNSGLDREYIIGQGSGFPLNIGWTHGGAFDDGIAIQIDTNNNVGIGTVSPITASPLFASGTSLYASNGFLSGAGNFYKVRAVTTDDNILITDYFITIDATGGNVTLTLPAASTAFGSSVGIQYVFNRLDNSGNTVTVQRNGTPGTDTINGATSFTLTTQYEVREVQCISTNAFAIK